MRRWLLVCAAALAALATTCGNAQFDALPAHEQDRWVRCTNVIRAMQCGTVGGQRDMMFETICLRGIGDRYAAEPTEEARQQFLVGQGCPAAMVGYAARSSSGGEATTAASIDADPAMLVGVPIQGRERERFDADTRRTSVELTLPVGHLGLHWIGEPGTTSPVEVAVAAVWPDQWRWRRCSDIELLADGASIAVSSPEHANDRRADGAYAEEVSALMPAEALARFAAAQEPRVVVCGRTLVVSAAQRPTLAHYAARFRPAAAADHAADAAPDAGDAGDAGAWWR